MVMKIVLGLMSFIGLYHNVSAMSGLDQLMMLNSQSKQEKFPIRGDATLGEEFTHGQLAAACCVGDLDILEHFKENYPEYLKLPYEGVYQLSLAAFSYIRGEPIKDIMPSIEGFKILAEDDSLPKDFKIPAGYGVMDFDEYILQEAHYADDAGKQERLLEIQKILVKNLSQERLKRLSELARVKKKKKAKLAQIRTAQSNKRNKIIAFVAGVVGVVGISFLYSKSVAKSKATTKIA